jgi:starvation-inducible DNA-binding protein
MANKSSVKSKPVQGNVAAGLKVLLASSYTLYLKTHNYHWNVTGPMFSTLHALFMTQYTELSLAVDEIAERIRSLGEPAPGSYQAFAELSDVADETEFPKARSMLETLVADQAKIVACAKRVIELAEAHKDQASVDLATRRIDIHEKNAWMLRSHLE